MKYALLILLSTQLIHAAQARVSTCEEAGNDLQAIERSLFPAVMRGSECLNTTPAQLNLNGLSAAQLAYFNASRCKPLSALEEELAQMESRILVSDGLVELKEQTVNRQNFIANAGTPSMELASNVREFAKNVEVGGMIQDLVDPERGLTAELMAPVPEGQSAEWADRIRILCRNAENMTKPFCQTMRDAPSDGALGELSAFLNELSVNPANYNPAALASYNTMLSLRSNGQPIAFNELHRQVRSSDLETYLSRDPASESPNSTITAAQLRVVRNFRLELPPANANPFLTNLVTRLRDKSERLNQVGQFEIFKRTMNDNAARHFARAKARWSQLWNHYNPNQELACRDATAGTELINCMASSGLTVPLEMRPIYDAIVSGAQLAADTLTGLQDCVSDPARLVAIMDGPATPTCSKAGLGNVDEDRANRSVLMAIRSQIATQENTLLQYRQRAHEELESCSSRTSTEYESAAFTACRGNDPRISVAPLVRLAYGSLEIIANGVRPVTPLVVTRDCSQLPQAVRTICSRINQPEPPADTDEDEDWLPGPVVRSRVLPVTRNVEMESVIIRDAIGGAVNGVTNQWISGRQQTDALRRQQQLIAAQMAAQRAQQPYSGMNYAGCNGLSNSVLCDGKIFYGFGTYYSNPLCPSCTMGVAPQAFRNFYGLDGLSSQVPFQQTAAPSFAPSSAFFGGVSSQALSLNVGQFGSN